jgi:signal peptidase I
MPKTAAKPKVKKASAKETPPKKGLSQNTKNWITIILLFMTFFIPLAGFVGVIMMWIWTTWKKWIKIVVTIPYALAFILPPLFLVIYIFLFRPFQMAGDSMLPTYHDKEYVMTNIVHSTGALKRDAVIIYKNDQNKKDFIKRIIGLPGDTVMIKDGSVYVNDTKIDESGYLASGTKTDAGSFMKEGQAVKVPVNSYFVLGDNRPYSSDSRENGFVNRNDIISTVSFCYYNCN